MRDTQNTQKSELFTMCKNEKDSKNDDDDIFFSVVRFVR